jgi:hypothetical protein
LASWDIQTDNINLSIAEMLLSLNKAVTPEDIQTVRMLWHQVSNGDSNRLAAVTILHANQMPIQPGTVKIVNHWLETQWTAAYRLTDTQNNLRQILTQLRSAISTNSTLSSQLQILENELPHIINWPIPIDSSSTEISLHLSDFLRSFGTTLEAELFSHITNPHLPAPNFEREEINQTHIPLIPINADSDPAKNEAEAIVYERFSTNNIGFISRHVKVGPIVKTTK